MNFKFICGALIVMCGTFGGTAYSKRYKRKMNFFIALENFCMYFKRELSFSSTTIGNILKTFSSENEDFNTVIGQLALWVADKNAEVEFPAYISTEEKNLILSFFSKIGKSDRGNELELISCFLVDVRNIIAVEKSKCLKTTGLFSKLGFFLGAIIFVILL